MMKRKVYDVIVVGGGAAGIGVAITLRDAGIDNFLVLERHTVGSSFAAWPDETRFITPSFTTNSVGMLDLNSIAIGTSPAFSIKVEHPTGEDYARYIKMVAVQGELPVQEKTDVLRVSKLGEEFVIDTDSETLRARHVIWAAGEFQYPSLSEFTGSDLCRHTAMIDSYEGLEGDDFVIIGGFESGIDAAYHLATRGCKVRVFDCNCPWEEPTSDPSSALSTFTLERMREPCFSENVKLYPNTLVHSVTRSGRTHEVSTLDIATMDERRFRTAVPPIMAGGFAGSHKLVMDLFEEREDGFPLLNEDDESTIVPGLHLCGPAVRHDGHIFCFIFKYRMRFAVVAKKIATSLGLPAPLLDEYRNWGMYLDDLSCCGEECTC